MALRLGLDIGTNSIGWALLSIHEKGEAESLIDIGTRIFRDGRKPQEKTSLAVGRRVARGIRRTHDRKLKRNKKLMDCLISASLMPVNIDERKALQALDPYELRDRAVTGKLNHYELGRAIYHLAQRRGFKSNRKTDGGNDTGVVKESIKQVKKILADGNFLTLGQLLFFRRSEGQGVKARRYGQKATDLYELYFDRQLVLDELEIIWQSQKEHLNLSDQNYYQIKDIFSYQRSLHPQEPGKCQFEKDEYRLAKAHPLFQRFRLLQTINNLKIVSTGKKDESLDKEQRQKIIDYMSAAKSRRFDQIRTALKRKDIQFNYETELKNSISGDEVAAAMISKHGIGKKLWYSLDTSTQYELVELLINEINDAVVLDKLQNTFKFDRATSDKLMVIDLPVGYGDLSAKVIKKIIPFMEEGDLYHEAMAKAGYDHASLSVKKHQFLPYYGEVLTGSVVGAGKNMDSEEGTYGKIANPTVHIALNQVRKLVNALIKKYGVIDQVVVETTRELRFGDKGRKEILKKNKENKLNNERIDKELASLNIYSSRENRQKYQLWEELGSSIADRRCVFTGEQISLAKLFSDEVEVEHLLPFSRSLNNSMSNKTLCKRRANRDKGNKTPEEAFSHNPSGYNWQAILARASLLPKHKQKLFQPYALESYLKGEGFEARHLNDTAYITRSVTIYLKSVADDVWSISGQMTALLRRCWELNQLLSVNDRKNRDDHRHHSIDALICALTDRALLHKISRAARKAEEEGAVRLIKSLNLPWGNFPDEIKQKVQQQIVSFKPDHGVQGNLFDQTALGIIDWIDNNKALTVTRDDLMKITTEKAAREIRDTALQEKVTAIIAEASSAADLKERLLKFSNETGTKKVRIQRVNTIIPIASRDKPDNQPYKAYKGNSNYCYEIFAVGDKWHGNIINTYTANQKEYREFQADKHQYYKNTFCGKPLIMRLQVDDMLAIEENSDRKIYRVVKISLNKIALALHSEGGKLKERHEDKGDHFRYLTKSPNALKSLNARRIFVDILGKPKDPGFSDDWENN